MQTNTSTKEADNLLKTFEDLIYDNENIYGYKLSLLTTLKNLLRGVSKNIIVGDR